MSQLGSPPVETVETQATPFLLLEVKRVPVRTLTCMIPSNWSPVFVIASGTTEKGKDVLEIFNIFSLLIYFELGSV
jgi:hypothetical protein